jgi:hemolysin D
MVREKPIAARAGADDTCARCANDGSQASGRELVCTTRVSFDRTQMEFEDRVVSLTPGMAVTVEIKTGSRRVIAYLLSPLLRYKQEAMRER